jgi:hypothetical protein
VPADQLLSADQDYQPPAATSAHSQGQQVIELHATEDWRQILLPTIRLNADGGLIQTPGALATQNTETLILRNPPLHDPHFIDAYQQWITQGRHISLEKGYAADIIQTTINNKKPLSQDDQPQPTDIWRLTPTHIDTLMHENYSLDATGKLIASEGLFLQALHKQDSSAKPDSPSKVVLHIDDTLSASQWHRLLQTPHSFTLSLSDNAKASLPKIYRPHFKDFGCVDLPESQITIEHCADISLRSYELTRDNPDTVFIDITPDTQLSDLVEKWSQRATETNKITTVFDRQPQVLLTALQEGNSVVLRGLEHQPNLRQELAALLNPPHYLLVNGQRLELNDLKLRVIEHHPPLDLRALNQQYQQHFPAAMVTFYQDLGNVLQRCGLVGFDQQPVFNFAALQKLQILLPEKVEQFTLHQLPRLLKDVLLTDYRQQPACYSYLKLWLKQRLLTPEAQSNTAIDVSRCRRLLHGCVSSQQLRSLIWPLANALGTGFLNKISLGNSFQDPQAIDKTCEQFIAFMSQNEVLRTAPGLSDLRSTEPISPPQATEDKTQKTLAKCVDILQKNPGLSLVGPPGTGKSYLVSSLIKELSATAFRADIGDESTEAFYQSVRQWAQSPKETNPCLVIDEANLAKPHYFAFLNELFNQQHRSCLLQGERIALSDQHKIIITGNGDHFAGRQIHALFKERFGSVYFKAFKTDALKQQIIVPFLQKILDATSRKMESYAEPLARLHLQLRNALPHCTFSPRNIEQCLMAWAAMPNFAEGQLNDLYDAFYNTYSGQLSGSEQQALRYLLTQQYGWQPSPTSRVTIPADLTDTANTQTLAQEINRFIQLRQFRMKHESLANNGQKALIIEGPAGVGKDALVDALLTENNIDHLMVNAHFDLAKLQEDFRDAMKHGRVVVLSEANVLGSNLLEALLNDALSGSHQQSVHPGFAVIMTINPTGYNGRQRLSPALLNRFIQAPIAAYTPKEVSEIVQGFANTSAENQEAATQIAGMHNRLIAALQSEGHTLLPTLRQIKTCLEQVIALKIPVEHQFKSTYAYYLALLESPAPTTVAKNPEQNSLQVFLQLVWPNPLTLPKLARGDRTFYDAAQQTFVLQNSLTDEESIKALMAFAENPDQFCEAFTTAPTISSDTLTALPSSSTTSAPSTIPNKESHIEPRTPTPTSGISVDFTQKPALGSMNPPNIGDGYLPEYRYTISLQAFHRVAANPIADHTLSFPSSDPRIELTIKNSTNFYFLPCLSQSIPYNVSINSNTIPAKQNAEGNWFIAVPENSEYPIKLHYSLRQNALALTAPEAKALEKPLDLSDDPKLAALVSTLKHNRPIDQVIQQLQAYFQKNYPYATKANTNYKPNMAPKKIAKTLMQIKTGKCVEFTTLLGLILQTHFNIPVRRVDGNTYNQNSGDISGTPHAWLEYWSNGKWIAAEATPTISIGTANQVAARSNSRNIHYEKVNNIFMLQIGHSINQPFFTIDSHPEFFTLAQYKLPGYAPNPPGRLNIHRLLQGQACFEQPATVFSPEFKTICITLSEKMNRIHPMIAADKIERLSLHTDIWIKTNSGYYKAECFEDIWHFLQKTNDLPVRPSNQVIAKQPFELESVLEIDSYKLTEIIFEAADSANNNDSSTRFTVENYIGMNYYQGPQLSIEELQQHFYSLPAKERSHLAYLILKHHLKENIPVFFKQQNILHRCDPRPFIQALSPAHLEILIFFIYSLTKQEEDLLSIQPRLTQAREWYAENSGLIQSIMETAQQKGLSVVTPEKMFSVTVFVENASY